MFGLKNHSGSCWINACLQGLFRIPELQKKFTLNEIDVNNKLEVSLQKIWLSKGKDGLKELFENVKNVHLPMGQGIGDSHELLIYILDKINWLENLCKINTIDKIKCTNCDYVSEKIDTKVELSLFPEKVGQTISECISKEVQEFIAEDSKCEKCNKNYKKQTIITSFPKVLILHVYTDSEKRSQYCSNLIINSRKYILISVLSHNGSHWWSYGRNQQGQPWYTLDDTRVTEHKSNEFPLSHTMRVLIYYQIDE
jgi:ubiquitin C-terminal hydrolase